MLEEIENNKFFGKRTVRSNGVLCKQSDEPKGPVTLGAKQDALRKLLASHEDDKTPFVLPEHECEGVVDTFLSHYRVPTGEAKYQKDEIRGVGTVTNSQYKSRCYALILTDGHVVPFSLKHLKARPDNSGSCLAPQRAAFRNAIFDQIQKFRLQSSAGPEDEVDHQPPFCKLREDFLVQEGHELKDVKVEYVDGQHRMEDKALEARWAEFHEERAQLESVSREENLKRWLQQAE